METTTIPNTRSSTAATSLSGKGIRRGAAENVAGNSGIPTGLTRGMSMPPVRANAEGCDGADTVFRILMSIVLTAIPVTDYGALGTRLESSGHALPAPCSLLLQAGGRASREIPVGRF